VGLIPEVGSQNSSKVSPFAEGDRCSSRLGFPPSTCTKSENCTTLKAYKNLSEDVEGCGFYPPYGKELICCPDQLPSFEMESTIAPL